jgi:hypothetical protein
MPTGYIGETPPASYRTGRGQYRGKTSATMQDTIRAYIAGFLDGDGSIHFQLVRRRDYVFGYQIRASVCFYQSTRNRAGLEWLNDQLGCGYIRDRAGSMSDYTIVGFSSVKRLLKLVQPFVVFKREQVSRGLDTLSRLETMQSPEDFIECAKLVDAFATLNYSKRKVINAECVQAYLSGKGLLVPVTTEALSQSRDHMLLPSR